MNREQAIMTIESYSTFVVGDVLVMSGVGEDPSISPEQMCAGVMLCDLMDAHNIKVEELWANEHPRVQQVCRYFVQGLLKVRTSYEHMVWASAPGDNHGDSL